MDQSVCANNAVVGLNGSVTIASGGVWTSDGTGFFSPDPNTLNAVYLPSNADTGLGTITLTLTTTGNGNCSTVSDNMVITIADAPTANAGADKILCADNAVLNLNGIVANASGGTWTSSGSGTFSPNANTLNATYTPSNADTANGALVLILTTTGTGAGCLPVSDTMNVTISPSAISVDAGNDTIVCSLSIPLSGTVTTASGGLWTSSGSGSFSPNDSTLNATYTFSSADTAAGSVTLTLTTTGNGGCLAKADSVLITMMEPIAINASASDTVCGDGNPIPLNVTVSTMQGLWSTLGSGIFTPSNTTLNASYVPSTADNLAGQVTLVFTSANNAGCVAATDTISITLLPAPFTDFNFIEGCLGLPTQFNDMTSTVGSIVSWNWDFGDASSSSAQSPSHTYASAGTFNVTLVTVSNYGCTDSVTKPVNVFPFPVADFSSTAQCFVDSVFFTDNTSFSSGSGTLVSWTWDFDDGSGSVLQNPAHVYTNNVGSYSVTLIVSTDHGCSDTITKNVTLSPAPKADFGADSACFKGATLFSDSSVISSGSVSSWLWNFGDGNTSSAQNPSYTFAAPGSYSVQLIATSAIGCKDTVTKIVSVYPLPSASFTYNGQCLEDGTNFIDISSPGSGNIVSWLWNFGDGTTDTVKNPTHFYSSVQNYPISLVVTTSTGCIDTVSGIIGVNSSPKADFAPDNSVVNQFDVVHFSDLSTNTDSCSAFPTWQWDFGDSLVSNSQNPAHSYSSGGNKTVRLVVTNAFCCTDTAYRHIIVNMPPQVPLGFSPNHDNQNDVLLVYGGPYSSLEFRIYNNWGELIFVSENQAIGWDGTKDGVEQLMGVYVYTLKATTEDGKKYQLHGDVTLIR